MSPAYGRAGSRIIVAIDVVPFAAKQLAEKMVVLEDMARAGGWQYAEAMLKNDSYHSTGFYSEDEANDNSCKAKKFKWE